MRRCFALLIIALLFNSCDDGDIIVTTFEFEEETFEMCGDERNKILYHISSEDVFETLTIAATSNDFSNEDDEFLEGLATLSLPLQANIVDPIEILLTGNNEVIYRTYDSAVPSDYFCQNIPPSSPEVLQEYRSVGGEIVISTNIIYNTGSEGLDHDGDGVPSLLEGMDSLQDTDEDGIPDYLDVDDDGDNVPTSTEITISVDNDDPTSEAYPDTDEDGIPNYLDPDDDDDGVLTIREITEERPSPGENYNEANDTPRYLDRFTTIRYAGEVFSRIENSIPVIYTSIVEAQNLKLQNQTGDGEEISFVNKTLGVYDSDEREILIFVDTDSEEDTEN